MDKELTIHLWVDIACPWSRIGLQQLCEALKGIAVPVVLEFHSYQLRADAPSAGHLSLTKYLAEMQEKSSLEVAAELAEITRVGAENGIEFCWERVQPVNSFLAHQLLASVRSKENPVAGTPSETQKILEQLWQAYFEEGANIADTDTLLDIAVTAGMDREDVEIELESGEYADEVRADFQAAEALNISSIPFFLLGEDIAVVGAQPAEVFLEAIEGLRDN